MGQCWIVGTPFTPSIPTSMSEHSLDSIVAALAAHRQRATYAAVAGVVNRPPRMLMAGRPRDAQHSWIVSKRTGRPTGYADDQVAPDLAEKPDVLKSREALLAWLNVAS